MIKSLMILFDMGGLLAGGLFLVNHANAIYALAGALSFVTSAIIKIISKKKTN